MAVVEPSTGRLIGYVKVLSGLSEVKAIANDVRFKILEALSQGPMYASELARRLKVSEQLICYHISKLKAYGLVKEEGTVKVRGALAIRYALPSDGFVVMFRSKEGRYAKRGMAVAPLLDRVFEEGGKVLMVLSSPEPHGPFRSRGRDHYLAARLAYAAGVAYGARADFNVVLDTDVRGEFGSANVIVFGGPAVNMVTASINEKLPIRFDVRRDNLIVSGLSGRVYHDDGCGVVELVSNPFGEGRLLLLAGRHLAGTKAALLSLFKKPVEISRPNIYKRSVVAHVVEGVDEDGDGEVDDVVILE